MNDRLQIQSILGYAASENPLRGSLDGNIYEGLIPAPSWTETVLKRNGSVNDTVGFMKKIIRDYAWQAKNIAPLCKGTNLYDTCKRTFYLILGLLNYCEDRPNREDLRNFSRSYGDRARGVDCDDQSIAVASVLWCLNIRNFLIRIARYKGNNYFSHVYIVVPNGKSYIVVDTVLGEFDAEKEPIEIKDFSIMDTNNLNGIDISMLGGVEDDTFNEISGILNGIDFNEVDELNGLGEEAEDWKELGAIRNHLIRTRNFIQKRPEVIRESENPENFLGMLNYALKYWDTDHRDKALGILAAAEDQINQMEGLQGAPDGYENIDLFYGVNPDGTYDVLGKAKKERKFFNNVKKAVKKVAQKTKQEVKHVAQKAKQDAKKVAQKAKQDIKKAGKVVKKVGKGIIRYNPVTASIREAVLLALKVNLFQAGSKLKWGYLTQAEAQAHGFDLNEWNKVKTALTKAEKLFVNDLQGKPENFKNAILTGRAGGLSGADVGLNGLGVAVAAASTAAAVPFITKLLSLLKNIDFGKLVGKVNVAKLIKNKKQAETEEDNTPDEDGNEKETMMPEPDESPEAQQPETLLPKVPDLDTGSNQNDPELKTDTPPAEDLPEVTVTASKQGVTITQNPGTSDSGGGDQDNGGAGNRTTSQPTDNGQNQTADTNNVDGGEAANNSLPATTNTNATPAIKTDTNPFTLAINWVKANPKASIAITATGAFILYQALKPSKKSLSGVRRSGKTKKGKAKNHPPKSGHNKKGKGGANKKFIL